MGKICSYGEKKEKRRDCEERTEITGVTSDFWRQTLITTVGASLVS